MWRRVGVLMHERYGLSWKVARQFAVILRATKDFREDYECGPTSIVIAPLLDVSTRTISDRIEEMEGMGLVRRSYLNGKAIPGSMNLQMQGHTFLRLWERLNGPLGFTFS
jgi:hypothetical protein